MFWGVLDWPFSLKTMINNCVRFHGMNWIGFKTNCDTSRNIWPPKQRILAIVISSYYRLNLFGSEAFLILSVQYHCKELKTAYLQQNAVKWVVSNRSRTNSEVRLCSGAGHCIASDSVKYRAATSRTDLFDGFYHCDRLACPGRSENEVRGGAWPARHNPLDRILLLVV